MVSFLSKFMRVSGYTAVRPSFHDPRTMNRQASRGRLGDRLFVPLAVTMNWQGGHSPCTKAQRLFHSSCPAQVPPAPTYRKEVSDSYKHALPMHRG